MNYSKLYNQIIAKAKSQDRTKGSTYFEKHHILPKCIGGSNDKSNLVLLTAKEHFICHKLLAEIYPDEPKLKYALWAMSSMVSGKVNRGYKVSSIEYQRLKESLRETQISRGRKNFTDNNPAKKISNRVLLSERMSNRVISEETKLKMASAKLGKPSNKSPNQLKKASDRMIGDLNPMKKLENQLKIRDSKLGVKNPMYGKTGYDHHSSVPIKIEFLDSKYIIAPSIKEAASILNVTSAAVIDACKKNKNSEVAYRRCKKALVTYYNN